MSRTITLAIAGPADIHPDNAADLLNDHLGDSTDVMAIVPITEDHLSEGLQTVLDFLEAEGIPFTAVTTTDRPRRIDRITRDADHIELVDNADDVEQHIVDMLMTAREDGHETAVMLLWGEDEDVEAGARDRAQTLLELAYDEDLLCLDLTAGLDSFAFEEDDEPAAEEEPEPEPEEKPARKRRTRKQEPEELTETEEELTEDEPAEAQPDTSAEPAAEPKRQPFPKSPREWKNAAAERSDEAQALIPPQPSQAASEPENAGQAEENPPGSLKDVLSAVYEHLRLVDEANAAVNLAPVRYRPLTNHVHAYLRSIEIQETSRRQAAADADLVKVFTETPKPAEDEPEAAPKRGKARKGEPELVAVLELKDGTFKKRGRGKPPAGSKLLDIPVEKARELGLVA